MFIPDYLEEYELVPEKITSSITEKEKQLREIKVDWEFLIHDIREKIMELSKRQKQLSSLDWPLQAELRDELLEANYFLSKLISSVQTED